MTRTRISKYKLDPNDPLPSIRWVSQHDLILEKVAEYRYSTTPMLSLVTPHSIRAINDMTQKLWRLGYLGRRHLTHPTTGGGSSPSIHILKQKGLDYLKREQGRGSFVEPYLRSVPPQVTYSKSSEQELKHDLLGSHTHAYVEAACAASPYLKLDFWYNESTRYYTDVCEGGKKYTVRPDAFSQISVQKDGQWIPYPSFWEFDRSGLDHPEMRRRYRGYFLLWRDRLRVHGFLSKHENITRFRVATVVSKASRSLIGDTETRLQNLLSDAYQADDYNTGSDLFLFARHEDLPLDKPANLFRPLWHVGHKPIKEPQPFITT